MQCPSATLIPCGVFLLTLTDQCYVMQVCIPPRDAEDERIHRVNAADAPLAFLEKSARPYHRGSALAYIESDPRP